MERYSYQFIQYQLNPNYEAELVSFELRCKEARVSLKRAIQETFSEAEKRKHYLLIRNLDIMTEQEMKFKEFFDHEVVHVKDMDDLTLEAHREKLISIAFEARVRIGAVDRVKEDRKPKISKSFRPITADEAGSEAINTIKKRQDQLTKEEKKYQKALENLVGMGLTEENARKMLSAGAMAAKLKNSSPELKVTKENAASFSPFSKDNNLQSEKLESEIALAVAAAPVIEESAEPLTEDLNKTKSFNPFKK